MKYGISRGDSIKQKKESVSTKRDNQKLSYLKLKK